MYKYKDLNLNKNEINKIENDILSKIDNLENLEVKEKQNLEEFIENVLYIQVGKKSYSEVLSFMKYLNNDYIVSYYYGYESFLINKNSFGIIYCSVATSKNTRDFKQSTEGDWRRNFSHEMNCS